MENNDQNQPQEQPGLMGAHVQYAKGVTQAAIGDMTGSHAWKSSGEQAKASGISAMQNAGEKRDPSQGYGKVEEWAGQATGCDGMKKEGATSSKKD